MPMQSSLENGVYAANNQIWQNQQANADKWASEAKANDDEWRKLHADNAEVWVKDQESWRTSWMIAQAAYAAAQTLLAEKSYDAAKNAADKQYEIANRQQTIADSEYQRYTQHFATCENATIDAECARPEYTEDIEAEANRAAADVRKQFSVARQQIQRRRSRYCVGAVMAQERQLDIEEARAVADAKEKARRFLEERQEQRRDKYFNRKLQLFNIGRGIKADAVGELGKSAQGIAAGTDLETAARHQFYGAVLSSFGGLLGTMLPSGGMQVPTGFGSQRSAAGGYVGMPGVTMSNQAMQQGIGMAGMFA